jgi:hypothetical protein
MRHNVLTAAAVKKNESEDIAPMKRGELIDLETKMRAAVADIPIAMKNLDIVVTVTKKYHLVTRVAMPMPSLEVLVDLKNRKSRAIVATKICNHANPARSKSLLHVTSLKKTRAGIAEGDLLILTVVIVPTRLSQDCPTRLPEHPDETVVSLPIIILAVPAVAANVERQMSRPPTIDAKQKG